MNKKDTRKETAKTLFTILNIVIFIVLFLVVLIVFYPNVNYFFNGSLYFPVFYDFP